MASNAFDALVIRVLEETFDDDEFVGTIVESDAFGALIYRVKQHTRTTGCQVVDVFRSLDEDQIDFARDADDPAAYLTAKVRDL